MKLDFSFNASLPSKFCFLSISFTSYKIPFCLDFLGTLHYLPDTPSYQRFPHLLSCFLFIMDFPLLCMQFQFQSLSVI